jgi:hypothetical protein
VQVPPWALQCGVMVAFVVAALLSADAAPPRAVVLVTRRTNLQAAEGQAILTQLHAALVSRGVTVSLTPEAATGQLKKLGFRDAATCSGRRECVMELGAQLGVEWVFSVSLAQVGKDRSIAVDLMRTSDAVVVEADAVVLAPGAQVTPELVAEFSERVKARWRPAESPTLVLTPTPTPKEPSPLPPPPAPPAPEPPRSHLASYVLGGLGAAALVGAGLVLGAGLQQRERLLGTFSAAQEVGRSSSLTFPQARSLNDQANLAFILSGVLTAVSAALGVVAVAVW